MTKKKRRPVRSIEKLSDDLRGQRALKGTKQMLVVTTSSLDRWISKADRMENEMKELIEQTLSVGNEGDTHKELKLLQSAVEQLKARYS